MKLFDYYSIRSKFRFMYIGFIIYLLFNIISAIILISRYNLVHNQEIALVSLENKLLNIENIQNDFFVNQSYNISNFEIDKKENNLTQLIDSTEQSLKLINENKLYLKNVYSISFIKDEFINYKKSIYTILELFDKLGNENKGYIGELNNVKLNVKKTLNEFTIAGLNKQFAELEMHEENFLRAKRMSDFEQFNTKINEVLNRLRNINVSNILVKYHIAKLTDQLTEYKTNFNLIFTKEAELGLTIYEGAKADASEMLTILISNLQDIQKEIKKSNKTIKLYVLIIFLITQLIAIVLGILFFRILFRSIEEPISKITSYIKKLKLGEFPEKILTNMKNEISIMADHLSSFVASLKEKSEFARQIGSGNFDAKFESLSENDLLGNALIEMQSSLQNANNEAVERKRQDELQDWINLGLAKFGDILRKNNDNILHLSVEVVRNIIKYLEVNQGAIYIIKKDDGIDEQYLEMTASFAYNQQKFIQKRIKLHEGLVGICAVEKRIINLDKLPNEYIKISSGFGITPSKYLLLVPLLIADEIYGVIELGSLQQIENHKIEFIKKLSEDIATTISYVKINQENYKNLQHTNQQISQYQEQIEELKIEIADLKKNKQKSDVELQKNKKNILKLKEDKLLLERKMQQLLKSEKIN